MTEEERLRQQAEQTGEAAAAPVYGGSYDGQIRESFEKITGREPFHYDVNGDALYQQYKDRYTQNARRSMRDTMGQAATLTGGYGSSYSQAAGQQSYDETMRGLTDMLPELEERAYSRYSAEGERLADQYARLMQLGAQEQATKQYDQAWDFQQRQYEDELSQYQDRMTQQQYANLSSAILASGYAPTVEELSAAGMTQEQADALRQAWVTSNPQAAWMAGAISGDDYWRLTGMYPVGYTPEGAGGGAEWYGGAYYNYDNAKGLTQSEIMSIQQELKKQGYDLGTPDGIWGPRTEAAYNAAQEAANATQQTAATATTRRKTGGATR